MPTPNKKPLTPEMHARLTAWLRLSQNPDFHFFLGEIDVRIEALRLLLEEGELGIVPHLQGQICELRNLKGTTRARFTEAEQNLT